MRTAALPDWHWSVHSTYPFLFLDMGGERYGRKISSPLSSGLFSHVHRSTLTHTHRDTQPSPYLSTRPLFSWLNPLNSTGLNETTVWRLGRRVFSLKVERKWLVPVNTAPRMTSASPGSPGVGLHNPSSSTSMYELVRVGVKGEANTTPRRVWGWKRVFFLLPRFPVYASLDTNRYTLSCIHSIHTDVHAQTNRFILFCIVLYSVKRRIAVLNSFQTIHSYFHLCYFEIPSYYCIASSSITVQRRF